jgi:hypothetical protein
VSRLGPAAGELAEVVQRFGLARSLVELAESVVRPDQRRVGVDVFAGTAQRAPEIVQGEGLAEDAARAATGLGNVHAAAGRLSQAELEWRRADGFHSRLLGSDVGEAQVRDELRNSLG